MTKINKRDLNIILIVMLLISVAYVLRLPDTIIVNSFPRMCGILRSFIYIGLFIAWGISVRNRIIQNQVRHYMTTVSILIVFWFLIRTINYNFIPDDAMPAWERYLWYNYYLGMLFIPQLSVLIALSIGKPEDYHLPKKTELLYIPTVLLFLLVITNDLHQLVFTFTGSTNVPLSGDYKYSIGYYMIVAWMIVCVVMMLFVLYNKCRIPGSKRRILLPCIPIVVLLIYCILYNLKIDWLRYIAGDITAVICLLYVIAFELCIQCRFIQSNTHYRELFDASNVSAAITDEEYNVCLSSKMAKIVPLETMHQTESGPVMLKDGTRLCSAPISGGYIFWQEDVSKLLAVLEELNNTQEELKDYGALLEEENKQKQRQRELEEQKRLFDAMQKSVLPAMEQLNVIIEQLGNTDDIESAKKLHGKVTVTGAYIKRRSNLVFLADQTGTVDARELLLCLNESISNLHLLGISGAVKLDVDGDMDGDTAGVLYDFFEAAIELSWDNLQGINVVVSKEQDMFHMTLMLRCEAHLSALADRFAGATAEKDEDVWYCSINVGSEVAKS